jgi:two-component system, OmpR family, response regulator
MTSALRLVTTNGRREPQPPQPEVDWVDRPIRAASPRVKPPSRATIMLVEDDVVTGRILAQTLEFGGYRVRIAATGSAACALQPRMRPDLIILDLMLPDMDGLALTVTLKAMTDTPIIICSARGGQVDRVLGLRLGAADFVVKPFDLDDFLARIEAVVPGVRKGQETTSEPTRTTRQRQA